MGIEDFLISTSTSINFFQRKIEIGLPKTESFPNDKKASDMINPDPAPELQKCSPSARYNISNQQKSSSPTDNSIQKDTPPSMNIQPPSEPSTPTNVHAEENTIIQANLPSFLYKPYKEIAEVFHHTILIPNTDGHKITSITQLWKSSKRSAKQDQTTHTDPEIDRNQTGKYATKHDIGSKGLCSGRGNDIKNLSKFLSLDAVRGISCTPDRFIDPKHPEKGLPSKESFYMELKQAPRVCRTRHSAQLLMVNCAKNIKQDRLGKTPQRDADHAGCLDTRKSTSGGIQFLGVVRIGCGEGGTEYAIG
ncbi:hypothetical protein Tco_0133211 [Tanacetum coccineum]